MDPFVVTRLWANAIAVAVLIGLLGTIHGLVIRTHKKGTDDQDSTVTYRRRGVKALVIGTDGRASTSKTQVVLWTFAVLYAFLFLLVWGRSFGCDLKDRELQLCQEAAQNQGTFDRFVEDPLEAEYYALLGLPTAAALAAKALTENKVVRGELTKPSVDETGEDSGFGKAVTEVIGGDEGQTDLIDFQYAAFNLVALGYFLLEFIANPSNGLPEIPPTLLALSGVAVAAYSGKKALEKNVTPAITAVIPSRIALAQSQRLTITGAGFGDRRKREVGRVLLEGFELKIDPNNWRDRSIDALVTDQVIESLREVGPRASGEISVLSRDGARSDSFTVELIESRGGGGTQDG